MMHPRELNAEAPIRILEAPSREWLIVCSTCHWIIRRTHSKITLRLGLEAIAALRKGVDATTPHRRRGVLLVESTTHGVSTLHHGIRCVHSSEGPLRGHHTSPTILLLVVI